MPLILPGNVASATASTTFSVDNSCRINRADSPSLTRDQSASPTHDDKGTLSFWFKIGNLSSGDGHYFFSVFTDSDNRMQMYLGSDNTLRLIQKTGGSTVLNLVTNRVFKDPSAWYHLVIACDSSQGTAANRIKIYINGVQETSFSTETYLDQNEDIQLVKGTEVCLGAYNKASPSDFLDAYLAEMVLIDGTQNAVTDFGEFDSDSPTIWKPIDVSGLTFGTNGFYLDFEDSADLGDDESGNTNDFTETNLDATDQCQDSPTNNFPTLNILDNAQSDATYSEGNLKWATTTDSHYFWGRSTIGMSAGKWYFEAKLTSAAEHNGIGICVDGPDNNTTFLANGGVNDEFEWLYKNNTGNQHNNTGSSSYGDSYTTGDIIGVYLDLDNNKLYFAKNGTIQNSGTGISITAPASTSTGNYFFCISDRTNGSSTTLEVNFGGCPAFAISSGNTDANDYGNFEYDPSDGGGSSFDSAAKDFLALCTKNLGSDGG